MTWISGRPSVRTAALRAMAGLAALLLVAGETTVRGAEPARPNILFAIADDWGWPHAGAYGDPVVKTPAFDRLATEGVLFHHAYVSSPSCTPCRGAVLTGQWHWRLEGAGNLWSVFPDKFDTYPELLAAAGYQVGLSSKGWGPGRTETPGRPLAGKPHRSFQAFLAQRAKGKPFCFWLGSSDPHRPYKKGSGAAAGMDLDRIRLFGCFPDHADVRGDVADYYFEVQRFDRLVGRALTSLEEIGELDNTVVLMTGDHGMPFPRCKANLYDSGARVPLAVRWPDVVKPGRTVDDFVSFTDLAPTFMEIAGLKPDVQMTGRSLMDILRSGQSGRVNPARDFVLAGKERHVPGQEAPEMGGYPCRAIRTHEFLYIRNFEPDRWPAGTPNYQKAAVPGAWLADCDNGPTKTYIVENRDKDATCRKLYDLAFGKRPAEELYDLAKDPEQLENVAGEEQYAEVRAKLAKRLNDQLRATGDPRVVGGGEKFDRYPYLGGAPKYPGGSAKKTSKRAGLLDIPEVTKDKVICFALYTVHDNILKLTAQLYPLADDDPRQVRLEVKRGGRWNQIAVTDVVNPGWTAPFRVESWDMNQEVPYRVRHGESAVYEGIIRKNPVDKEEFVVAAFTGNSIYPGHGGDIPKTDIIANLKHIKPDLLFFSGDQVYDHNRHYAYWLRFGRDFGPVIRNTPTITIPDDHDVGHANLWGAGGKQSFTGAGHDGGYFKPVEYVREAERAQTSHLPDPYDPTPIQRGIGVYYTALNWGGISFAIIEDRKFKTGPAGLVPKMGPRPDHVTDPNYDPNALDVPGAVLLGRRQLKFLREWAADWRDAEMKAVLSQTIFCGGAHLHGSQNNRLVADLDSNGWPQTGRNKALAEIRKAFALHIAGDQHLATILHHGIDDWNDAMVSLCVPSIANLYLRWWAPPEPGKNRLPGMPEHTGEFLDGLGNKVTVWAVANPSPEANRDKLTTRSAGFGVARFNKSQRTITLECWPRNVDASDPAAKQYPGWPKTIHQSDNYGRKAVAYLPTLKIRGTQDPVVQVIDQSDGQIVYTLRITGREFRPKVFHKGSYTIKVGQQPGAMKELKDVEALDPDVPGELSVELPKP